MNISDRAEQLVNRAPEVKPRCPNFCVMLLVKLEDKIRIWRCEVCDHQIKSSGTTDAPQGNLF